MNEIGYKHYMFVDGDLPGNGDDMTLPGHEALMITNRNAEDAGGKKYTENTQKVYTFSVILSYHVMTDKLRTRITVRVTTNLRGTNRRLCAVDRAAFGTAIVRGAKVFTAFCTQHTDPFLSWGHTPCVRALFINP